MAFSDGYTYIDPSIILVANPTGTPPVPADVELMCITNEVHLVPEDSMTDQDTFCNPDGEKPGSTTWTFSINALLGFTEGSDVGSWNTLHPLRKTKQTFRVKPHGGAISTGNPEATFQMFVPSIPFLDGSRGETSRFSLEAKTIGEPVFDLTP